jgi:hypothetical protein
MKLSYILPLVVGSAAAGVLASTSPAHALDFNFNFTGNNGTVSGTIYGLQNNTTSSASDITINSTSNPFQLYHGSIYNTSLNSNFTTFSNSFTVSNGQITSANFSFTSTQVFLTLNSQTPYYNYQNNAVATNTSNITYSSATPVPFDIPGGATIPSVGALLALGAMRKSRKSVASKTRLANPVTAMVS